ncbi:MAG TPA: hypothetical protein VGC55_17175 [Dokdonella sp.]
MAQSLIHAPAKADTSLVQDFHRLGATQVGTAGQNRHDRERLTDYQGGWGATPGNVPLQNTPAALKPAQV